MSLLVRQKQLLGRTAGSDTGAATHGRRKSLHDRLIDADEPLIDEQAIARSNGDERDAATQQKGLYQNRTLVAYSTADAGIGSLRQALSDASPGDTINVTARGLIALSSGELVVSKDLTIRGPGKANLGISGSGLSRVFHITPGVTVSIEGLTITNGRANGTTGFPTNAGGGVFNDHAQLTLRDSVVSGNNARLLGGGIFSNSLGGGNASLTLVNTTVVGNAAERVISPNLKVPGYGGGILSGGGFLSSSPSGDASLTLTNSTITENSAYYGGAILNDGFNGTATLVINGSMISSNHGASAFSAGAGIYNNGDSGVARLTLTDSTVRANSIYSDPDGGIFGAASGGGIFNDGGSSIGPGSADLTLINSTVSDHAIDGLGGGIFNYGSNGDATLRIRNSHLSRNTSVYGGGIYNDGVEGNATLAIAESAIENNIAASGGGILNDAGFGNANLMITNSTLSGNISYELGGGIVNYGIGGNATVTIDQSNLSGNRAHRRGGGIYNESADGSPNGDPVNEGIAFVTVTNSTLSGNSAGNEPSVEDPVHHPGEGGGIFNTSFWVGSSTVNLTNSTLSDNSSNHVAGGIQNFAYAEGSAAVTLDNCTLNGNFANDGGSSLYNMVAPYQGWGPGIATLNIANTILNAVGSGGNLQNISGTVISRGYNLSSDAVGGDAGTGPGGLLVGPGDIRNTNPLLGPLKNNGGTTLTHALLPGSPAIDRGNPGFSSFLFAPPLIFDQRGLGFARVVSGRIDIGAFESGNPAHP